MRRLVSKYERDICDGILSEKSGTHETHARAGCVGAVKTPQLGDDYCIDIVTHASKTTRIYFRDQVERGRDRCYTIAWVSDVA